MTRIELKQPRDRDRWYLDVDTSGLTVVTPQFKQPWHIPHAAIAGGWIDDRAAATNTGRVLTRGPRIINLLTRGVFTKPKMAIAFRPPQSLPPVKFGQYRGLGIPGRAARHGTALVDVILVTPDSPEAALATLAAAGKRHYESREAGLLDIIESMPAGFLSDEQRRRIVRTRVLRTVWKLVTAAMVIGLIVARWNSGSGNYSAWTWYLLGAVGVLFAASWLLSKLVRRRDQDPLGMRR